MREDSLFFIRGKKILQEVQTEMGINMAIGSALTGD
jgi:hypothetical protein